jgi:hypothetical protein
MINLFRFGSNICLQYGTWMNGTPVPID